MITHTETATLIGVYPIDSPEWHEAREGISGSDIGPIMAASPFKSAYTLWAEKTGLINDRIEPNDAMTLGTLFEAPIRRMFEMKHPEIQVHLTGTWQSNAEPTWKANPDGFIEYDDGSFGILEIKQTSQYWSELPLSYRYQVQWYLHILGFERAVIAAVCGGRYTEFYETYDPELMDRVEERVAAFEYKVRTGQQLEWDDSDSTYETVRTLSPGLRDAEVELGHLWLNLWLAKDAADQAERTLTAFKSATLAQMEGAKYGLHNGERVITLQSKNNKPFITFNK